MRLLVLGRKGMPSQCPCPQLQARGVEILAVAANRTVAAQYEEKGVPAIVLPFGSRWKLNLYVALLRGVRSFRPDVIHIFENRDVLPTIVAARSRRIPLVFY